MTSLTPQRAPLVNDLVGRGYSMSRFEYVDIIADGLAVDERRRRKAAPPVNNGSEMLLVSSSLLSSIFWGVKLDGSLGRASGDAADIGSKLSGVATISSLVDSCKHDDDSEWCCLLITWLLCILAKPTTPWVDVASTAPATVARKRTVREEGGRTT